MIQILILLNRHTSGKQWDYKKYSTKVKARPLSEGFELHHDSKNNKNNNLFTFEYAKLD